MFIKTILSRYVIGCLLLVLSLVHHQSARADIEFFSISEMTAIMYDAPSLKAEKLYVASRYLPVEVVVSVADWVKVRDSSGALSWVERKALSPRRYVIVTRPLANVYQQTNSSSDLIFQVKENVVMEWLGVTDTAWVNVRHRDGQTGYIRMDQVWGL